MANDSGRGKYANPEGSATWEYASAACCFLMMFCIGGILGWTSPGLAILMGANRPMLFTESDVYYAMLSGGVGYAISPILIIFSADKLGRKNTLIAVTALMILYWGLIVVAKDASALIMARFIAGIATGLGLCAAPMYLGEIASVKLRGALGAIIGTSTNAGLLSVFVGMPYMSLSTSACVCLTIATGSMISLWFIPESPYFLTMRGKIDKAESALEKLRGKTEVSEELDLIKRTISRDEDQEGGQKRNTAKKCNAVKELITVPGNRKSFLINFVFLFVLQMGGYVINMVYTQIIFEAMKSRIPAHICASIMAILQLVFNIVCAFLVERFGRRPLICITGVVSGSCNLVIAIFFYLMKYTHIDVSQYDLIPLGAMFVNMIAMSVGLMPLQMVIQSETLATEIKSLAICLIGISGGVLTTISTGLYLKLAITWGYGHCVPFFGFCIITWTSTAIIVKLLPETKGKNFLEIQRDLNK